MIATRASSQIIHLRTARYTARALTRTVEQETPVRLLLCSAISLFDISYV